MRQNFNQPYIAYAPTPKPSPLIQAAAAIMIGLFLFSLAAAAAPVIFNLSYQERIYPGVSVGGVDLSGLSLVEAENLLNQSLDYPQRGRIVFQEGENVWEASPNQLGLFVDSRASALAAYSLGRQGNLVRRIFSIVSAWDSGLNLPPLLVYDERAAIAFLNKIAAEVNVPIVEAALSINGTEVVVTPGQVGRQVDVELALDSVQKSMQSMTDGLISLQVRQTAPIILDASHQAEIARQMLSVPFVVKNPDHGEGETKSWNFAVEKLAVLLKIQRVSTPEGETYQIGLDEAQLIAFLQGIAPSFNRTPENARFIFNDDTRQLELIQPGVIGRSLDIETSLKVIQEQVLSGEHSATLDMEYTNPAVTDQATSEQLDITGLVSSHSSYFFGSSASRIQNIQTAAARFHGVLVPPGGTFSMADVLGDVSLDTGYEEAWIIFGDRTIKGVGGGVCQVSTTLFRTAFLGGFPIVERYPHAYRVGYYEQTSSGAHDVNYAGLDATVFVPVVDFKFVNDTSYWLLMETYVNTSARRLTWKFYSTLDGRTVEWQTSGLTNKVEPPDPLYEENKDLSKGEIKQVDYEAEGADVTITRTVYRNGSVYLEDQYATHYLPWRAVYEYGPGTKIPDQDDD